jgi:VanZ family protein
LIVTFVWLSIVLLLSIIQTEGLPTGHPRDKVIHFIIYGITAILFLRVLRSRTSLIRSTALSIILASVFGLAMELLQSVLPWREFSLADELANIGGAFFFGILYVLKDYHRKKS